MISKIFAFSTNLLFLFLLCSCGVKTDPVPPPGSTLPSYLNEHYQNYRNNSYKTKQQENRQDKNNQNNNAENTQDSIK